MYKVAQVWGHKKFNSQKRRNEKISNEIKKILAQACLLWRGMCQCLDSEHRLEEVANASHVFSAKS